MLSSLHDGSVEDAKKRQEQTSLAALEQRIESLPAPINIYEALAPADTIKIIAEIKRASPSRGALADIPDPVELALKYELGGASAVSVLTEGRKFLGSLEDLTAVKQAISLPVLRKDFIGIPYQVYEARAAGADFILLILAAIDDKTAAELADLAAQLGLGVLVEAHDETEVKRAVQLGAKLIGINARNLSTFELDKSLFGKLQHLVPAGAIKVAESAVLSAADVRHYRDAGADAVLVGEALVTSDPVQSLRDFLKG